MHSPQRAQGRGGVPKGVNEQVGSLWDTLFSCCFFDAFSAAILGPLGVILKPLGTYFGSLLGPCSQFLAI